MFSLLLSQMGFSLSRRRHDDSSDQGQEKLQKGDGDAGCISKLPRTEKGGKELVVSPTASKLKAEPIPFKVIGER